MNHYDNIRRQGLQYLRDNDDVQASIAQDNFSLERSVEAYKEYLQEHNAPLPQSFQLHYAVVDSLYRNLNRRSLRPQNLRSGTNSSPEPLLNLEGTPLSRIASALEPSTGLANTVDDIATRIYSNLQHEGGSPPLKGLDDYYSTPRAFTAYPLRASSKAASEFLYDSVHRCGECDGCKNRSERLDDLPPIIDIPMGPGI